MNAAIAKLRFETDSQIAAASISVRFDYIATILKQKGIIALKAILTFCKMVAKAIFCAEMM